MNVNLKLLPLFTRSLLELICRQPIESNAPVLARIAANRAGSDWHWERLFNEAHRNNWRAERGATHEAHIGDCEYMGWLERQRMADVAPAERLRIAQAFGRNV